MSTTMAILFIIGKSLIWLLIPLALGIWELRRHRKMMAEEKAGTRAPEAASMPQWLERKKPLTRTPKPRPSRPVRAPEPTPAPVVSEPPREAA